MVDLVLHKIIWIICESRRFELRSTAAVLPRDLKINNRLDPMGIKLLDQLIGFYLSRIGSSHGQDVICDPMRVNTSEGHILFLPWCTSLILASFPPTEHGTLHLIGCVLSQAFTNWNNQESNSSFMHQNHHHYWLINYIIDESEIVWM